MSHQSPPSRTAGRFLVRQKNAPCHQLDVQIVPFSPAGKVALVHEAYQDRDQGSQAQDRGENEAFVNWSKARPRREVLEGLEVALRPRLRDRGHIRGTYNISLAFLHVAVSLHMPWW